MTPEPRALQENKQSRHVERCQPPVNSNVKSWLAGSTRPCRCGLLNGVGADTGPQTQWACSQRRSSADAPLVQAQAVCTVHTRGRLPTPSRESAPLAVHSATGV